MFNRIRKTWCLAALGAVAFLGITTTQAQAGNCHSYSRPAYSHNGYARGYGRGYGNGYGRGYGGYRSYGGYGCGPRYVGYARPVCAPRVVYAEPAYYAPPVVHYAAPVYPSAYYGGYGGYGGYGAYGYSGPGFGFSYHKGGCNSGGYAFRIGF